MADEAVIPRLRRGVKFRFDETRQAWVLLAPERLFTPQGTAVEILKRVDGQRTVQAIVDDLASVFQAPRELIARDVETMLRDLETKGAVSL